MCSAQEFPCIVSEQCIPASGRCDGTPQCNDGTDEMNCEGCGSGYFHCLKSNQCVPLNERCDVRKFNVFEIYFSFQGVPQCLHGEDELLCKVVNERFYICENRLDQVPIAQVCDNIENCPDGSDEKYCNQAAVAPHSSGPIPLQNAFLELMNQAAQSGPPQGQFSSIPQAPNQEYDQEEEAEEEEELPAHPLLPIAKFSLPPLPPTTARPTTARPTTTRPPTTRPTTRPTTTRPTTTRKPRLTVAPTTVSIIVESNFDASVKKYPFAPPGNHPNPIQPSGNIVSVTAPPVPVTPKRVRPIDSVTITTTAPSTYQPEAQQEVTKSVLLSAAESVNELDQELIQKLSAKFSNNGRFSPRQVYFPTLRSSSVVNFSKIKI